MWKTKKLNDMTSMELYQCLKLRVDTFVVEQSRIYHEVDADDLKALHVFHFDDQQKVDAYARVFPDGDHISFGRVVIAKSVRGTGMGTPLMKHILAACQQLQPRQIVILAQQQVSGFYEHFGFRQVGQPFIHESTPHIKMVRSLD